MTAEQKTLVLIAAAIAIVPIAAILAVKAGHPNSVWLYCGMLKLC